MNLWDDQFFVDYLQGQWRDNATEKDVYQIIARYTPVVYRSVLDVGCGTGRMRSLFWAADYMGIDSSEEMVRRCIKNGIPAMRGSIYQISVSHEFDLVLCHAVLFHIDDFVSAVRELWRVTRKRLVFSCYWNWLLHQRKWITIEDTKQGKQWVALNHIIPSWVIVRLIQKELKPARYKIDWHPGLTNGRPRMCFVVMERQDAD